MRRSLPSEPCPCWIGSLGRFAVLGAFLLCVLGTRAVADESSKAKLQEFKKIADEVFQEQVALGEELNNLRKRQKALGKELLELEKKIQMLDPSREVSERKILEQRKSDLIGESRTFQKQADALVKRLHAVKRRRDDAVRETFRILSGVAADDDNPQVIRISTHLSEREVEIVTDAYRKTHPKVQFLIFRHQTKVGEFLKGRIDVMVSCFQLAPLLDAYSKKKFKEALSESPEETVLGYRPAALMVHPRSPLTQFTRKQFRLLIDQKGKTWKDLGRKKDGPIKLCYHQDHFLVQEFLSHDSSNRTKKPDPFEQPKRRITALKSYRPTDNKTWYRKSINYLSKEENGLGLFTPDRSFTASGLKILPLVPRDGKGKPVLYDDLAAVASGRYWLREPLFMAIHPKAKPVAKEFYKWLQTPEAAEAIIETHRASKEADHPFAPASLRRVRQDAPSETNDVRISSKEPPLPPPRIKIDGAVAVLPFVSVSRYFRMADDSHLAFYEDTLFEAIEQDGRLTMVDRTQLRRTIAEQKLSLIRTEALSERPIIAADVFIVPRLVTRKNKTYLRIEAVHGASATSLGMLEVALDPANPAKFNPPLQKQIDTWWPWILDTLQRVHTRPRWYVHDVTCEKLDQVMPAAEVLHDLRHLVQRDRRIAPAGGPAMTLTQQERLLNLMGMTENRADSFVPRYDYAIEGRLQPDGTLRMILRDAWFKRLAEKEFKAFDKIDTSERRATVQKWVKGQIASHTGRVLPQDASPQLLKRWARLQSRLEHNHARDLAQTYERLYTASQSYEAEGPDSRRNLPLVLARHQSDRHRKIYQYCMKAAKRLDPDTKTPPDARIPSVDKKLNRKRTETCYVVPDKKLLSKELTREILDHWLRKATDNARKYHEAEATCKKLKKQGLDTNALYSSRTANWNTLHLVADRYWRHAQRVVQLDPMWERGARPLVGGGDIGGSWYCRGIDFSGDAVLDAECFFLSRFPKSKRYESILYGLMADTIVMGKLYPSDSDFSPQRTAAEYTKMSVEASMEFCRRYVLPNEIHSGYMSGESRFQHYGILLGRIRAYFIRAGATPENEQWVLSLWQSQLGENTDKGVPHTDFIRLFAASVREDVPGFFKILRSLQERWPDPEKLPWEHFNNDKENPSTYRILVGLVDGSLQKISYKMKTDYDRLFRNWAEGKIATKDLWWSNPDFRPLGGRMTLCLYSGGSLEKEAPGFSEIRKVVEAYQKKYPDIKVNLSYREYFPSPFPGSPEKHIALTVGSLPEYKTGFPDNGATLSRKTLGYLDPGGKTAKDKTGRAVTVQTWSTANKQIRYFLDWLSSPEGRKTLNAGGIKPDHSK